MSDRCASVYMFFMSVMEVEWIKVLLMFCNEVSFSFNYDLISGHQGLVLTFKPTALGL